LPLTARCLGTLAFRRQVEVELAHQLAATIIRRLSPEDYEPLETELLRPGEHDAPDERLEKTLRLENGLNEVRHYFETGCCRARSSTLRTWRRASARASCRYGWGRSGPRSQTTTCDAVAVQPPDILFGKPDEL